MAKSDSEKALDAITVSESGIPYTTWPPLQDAINRRKRRVRNSRILRDYLAALNKDEEVKRLSIVWSLTEGRIRSIIEQTNVPGAVVADMASEIEVLRQIKRAEIIEDGQNLRDELQAQITQLELSRSNNVKWGEIEEIDTTGEKPGVRTKKIPINQAIKELKEQVVASHRREAEALEMYIPKPKQEFQHNINTYTDEEIEAGLKQAGYGKIENAGQIQGEQESEKS